MNQPVQLAKVLQKLEEIQKAFNAAQSGGKKVSLADLIVLAGGAGVEQAARNAGLQVQVPFTPGRMDAPQAQTDVESFAVLEPIADGFRNYQKAKYAVPAEALLIDRAQLLTLTAPEMTVLVGGLRVLGANVGPAKHGVLHAAAGIADQRFFRQPARHGTRMAADLGCERRVRRTRSQDRCRAWTATRVDLVFGSNSQLRALAEVYGSADAQQKFVQPTSSRPGPR